MTLATQTEDGTLVIDNVALPFRIHEDVITPDFGDLMDYWTNYRAHGGKAGPREYLLLACKELERKKIRGRSSNDWLQRIMEHYGMGTVSRFFLQGDG